MRRAPLTGLLVLALAAVSHGRGAEPEDAGPTWSERDERILLSLSLRGVDAPPASPSNRIADLPGAAELGRRLFFDTRLSGNGKVSCASCHRPELYFTDGKQRSVGTGTTARNAPTVVGSAFNAWFYWDGRRDSLWSQALIPIEAPEEMGGSRTAVMRLLAEDEAYLEAYRKLFGDSPPSVERFETDAGPFGDAEEKAAWAGQPEEFRRVINRAFANVGKAIAAYERTLMPATTRFDRYVDRLVEGGEEAAVELLTPQEIAGARLFIDEKRTQCLQCHNGPMMTNGGFHNIGTGNFTGEHLDFGRVFGVRAVLMDEFNCLGSYSDADPDDCLELRFLNTSPHVPLEGAFKVPSLRNVASTAPYMHDGSLGTLEAVIAHYRDAPRRDGPPHELRPLDLSQTEAEQLLAFLRSLGPD